MRHDENTRRDENSRQDRTDRQHRGIGDNRHQYRGITTLYYSTNSGIIQGKYRISVIQHRHSNTEVSELQQTTIWRYRSYDDRSIPKYQNLGTTTDINTKISWSWSYFSFSSGRPSSGELVSKVEGGCRGPENQTGQPYHVS